MYDCSQPRITAWQQGSSKFSPHSSPILPLSPLSCAHVHGRLSDLTSRDRCILLVSSCCQIRHQALVHLADPGPEDAGCVEGHAGGQLRQLAHQSICSSRLRGA